MDDGFDSDSRVMRAGTAAFGLYSRCGVWVARNLTDGLVPTEVAALYGTREWIDKLVATGLWSPVEGGFAMPDYLEPHGNKTAERVRELRAAAAARQQKLRDGKTRRRSNTDTSRGMSRVTNGVTTTVSHTSLSDPPPKGGEEGDAPLRGGGAPPSRQIKTTTGRLICETHQLEISDTAPCRGCLADARVDDDLADLDQRPPVPHSPAKRPPAATDAPDDPPLRQRILTERAVAAGLLSARPEVRHHLDAAVDQLLAAGTEVPIAEDIVALAADLATRPEPNGT